MSDEDHTVFTPPRAAIPSRQGAVPLPMFDEPVKPVRRKPHRKLRKVKVIPVKTTRQRKKVVARMKPAKNPNRPMELKNQLSAVLG